MCNFNFYTPMKICFIYLFSLSLSFSMCSTLVSFLQTWDSKNPRYVSQTRRWYIVINLTTMHHLIPQEKSNDNKGKESIDFEILE